MNDGDGGERRSASASTVLVIGIGAAALYAWRALPADVEVALRLEGDRAGVTRLEARLGTESDEPLGGATWSFAAGTCPPVLRFRARARHGAYALTTRTELRDTPPTTAHLTVRIDSDRVSVRLPVVGDAGPR